MAIIMNKQAEKRSELTDRVTTSLKERERRESGKAETDFVEDSEYRKGLKKTGRFAWIWFVLILLAIISLIVIFLF